MNRNIIEQVIDYLKIIESTFGPSGKPILVEDAYGVAKSTQDGANIISHLTPPEPSARLIFLEIKKTIEKISREVGDGTTTSAIMAISLLEQLKCFLDNNPSQLMSIVEGMISASAKAKEIVEQELTEKITILDYEKIEQVATVSSKNSDMGRLIQEAYENVGKNGIVEVVKSSSIETTLEKTSGFVIEKGYINPSFINDLEKSISHIKNSYVLIYNQNLSALNNNFINLLSEISKEGKGLLIIADSVSGLALDVLLFNKNSLKCVCVASPSFGNYRRDILDDISIVTGATVIDDKTVYLKDLLKEHLGFVDQVKISATETRIMGNNLKLDPNKIDYRKKSILFQIKNAVSKGDQQYELEVLKKRLARLEGGVCYIRVGGINESDQNARYDLVQDAVAAVEGALDSGIYSGGGITLVKVYFRLCKAFSLENMDFTIGVNIFKESLLKIIRTILKNNVNYNLKDSSDVILNRILLHHEKDSSSDFGFDVKKGVYVESMKDSGIIDTAKVMIIAMPYIVHQIKNLISLQYIIINKTETSEE